jgi:hypothetical protein
LQADKLRLLCPKVEVRKAEPQSTKERPGGGQEEHQKRWQDEQHEYALVKELNRSRPPRRVLR